MSEIDSQLMFDPEIHQEYGGRVLIDQNRKGALAEARATLEYNLAYCVEYFPPGRWVAGPTFGTTPDPESKQTISWWYGIWQKDQEDAA